MPPQHGFSSRLLIPPPRFLSRDSRLGWQLGQLAAQDGLQPLGLQRHRISEGGHRGTAGPLSAVKTLIWKEGAAEKSPGEERGNLMFRGKHMQNLTPWGLERVPSVLCPLSLHPHLRTETNVLTS